MAFVYPTFAFSTCYNPLQIILYPRKTGKPSRMGKPECCQYICFKCTIAWYQLITQNRGNINELDTHTQRQDKIRKKEKAPHFFIA